MVNETEWLGSGRYTSFESDPRPKMAGSTLKPPHWEGARAA